VDLGGSLFEAAKSELLGSARLHRVKLWRVGKYIWGFEGAIHGWTIFNAAEYRDG
jgi:hypothetical protein